METFESLMLFHAKKITRIILSLLIVQHLFSLFTQSKSNIFTMFSSTVYASATIEEQQEIENAQALIMQIESQKRQVEGTLKNLQKIKKSTKQYIEELDKTIQVLDDKIHGLEQQIIEKEAQIQVTLVNLRIATTNEAFQYASMKKRIQYMYENANISYIDLIFGSQSWEEVLSHAEYITQISAYDRKKLEELVAIRNEIDRLSTALVEQKTKLELLNQEALANKFIVQTALNEKNAELANTNSLINMSNVEIDKLERAIRAQEANVARIEEEIRKRERASGKTRSLIGGFIWPLPSSHNITSGFGRRSSPTKGASTFHKGIDISASPGDKVIAAASGEVVISEYSYSAGNYIMINHGSGMFTIYMHLSKRLANVGDEVSQGQQIGKAGSTGYSTGTHLHFGVRKNGDYVDPRNYV